MASVVAVQAMNKVPRVDPEQFKVDPSSSKLDIVLNSQAAANSSDGGNSVAKIARYKPTELKDLSADIQISVDRRKQAAQVRSAEEAMVKERIKESRDQNPFNEAGSGGKVNISA